MTHSPKVACAWCAICDVMRVFGLAWVVSERGDCAPIARVSVARHLQDFAVAGKSITQCWIRATANLEYLNEDF
jgi:hypothetical protein